MGKPVFNHLLFNRLPLFLSVFIMCGSLSGCFLFNPYKGDFSCPQADKGKCVSVPDAYKEDLSNQKGLMKLPPDSSKNMGSGLQSDKSDSAAAYQKEVFDTLAGLLKKPPVPVIKPPTVMRVLFLPYEGDSRDLFMPRYVYLMVDDARWVLGGYLTEETSN